MKHTIEELEEALADIQNANDYRGCTYRREAFGRLERHAGLLEDTLTQALAIARGGYVPVKFKSLSSWVDAIMAYHSDDAEFCHNLEKDFKRITTEYAAQHKPEEGA